MNYNTKERRNFFLKGSAAGIISIIMAIAVTLAFMPYQANASTYKIMLDAGHAGLYNRGYYKTYYESLTTWKITNYLKSDLNNYSGIKVDLTKTSLNDDPSVYGRGLMAKGHNLFISIHTNSGSTKTADYPLVIIPYGKTLRAKVRPLSDKIGLMLQKTMWD